MKIAIGADHAGFALKEKLRARLTSEGHEVVDYGTSSEESCDYPDFPQRVGRDVAQGRCDRGILVCGTGIGMAIAANKVSGVRAARMVDIFLETEFLGGRHSRRLAKIAKMEMYAGMKGEETAQ